MGDLSGHIIKTYEIRDQLGSGGFGAVYRAYQPVVGREVAIKVILPEYANHPDFIYRFEAEAQLVARLEHPHIVPLYDYWREPDGAYLVMRLLQTSLRQELRSGHWTVLATARLLDQIGSALTTAHRHNVIHRDIKPDNILLDEDKNCYLADFGIAKSLDKSLEATHSGAIVGSPAYITPEQIRGLAITPQSDQYSLSLVLFEMLTGDKPYPTSLDITALIYKHLNEPLPALSSRRADLPPELDGVLQRAAAKEAALRFPDIQSMVTAFQCAIADSQVALINTPSRPQPINEKIDELTTMSALTVENPYKGLRAFQEADASDFYGRTALTEQILHRMAETGPSSHFLAVVGPSGSGKSSVVRAGVIPELRRGSLPGSRRWYIVEMIPGAHPLEELEGALLRVAVNPPASLISQLREDERGLLRAIKRVLPGDETSELVLFIDQFEEVFTLSENEQDRIHFLNSIVNAVNDPRGRLRVIITLRADFYDRPLLYPGFGDLMRNRAEVVLPLSLGELEQAIAHPAERVGVTLQTGLLTAIVHEVVEQPGVLPMLQYALTELFDQRQNNQLRLDVYQAGGGVSGSLARRAEELYTSLNAEEQEAAHQIFLRLVTLGEGMEDTRRRVLRSEFGGIGTDKEPIYLAINHVIELYNQYRLLTIDRDPVTRSPTVEVAHEALIRTWVRLREWLDNSREDLRTHRRFLAAVGEWVNNGCDPSFLLSGSRLVQFETWAGHSSLALTPVESSYLSKSIAARDDHEKEERNREVHELELAQQAFRAQHVAANRLRYLVGVLVLFLMATVGLSAFAFDKSNKASTSAEIAMTAQQQALNDEATSVISLQKVQESVSAQLAQQAKHLFESDNQNPELTALLALRALYAAYRPDAESILTNSIARNYTLRLFNGPQQPVNCGCISAQHQITSVAMSSSGRYIVTGNLDNTAKLWDTQTGAELHTFSTPTSVSSVAISPDEKYVLIGGHDNSAQLWNIQTGQPMLHFGEPRPNQVINSVAFSPDGKWVLTGSSDATAQLWDVQTGQALRQFTGHTQPINAVAFSPNGKWVLTGSSDATAQLWDVQTGESLHTFQDTARILHVAFSPDGQKALTSTLNNAVVWDINTYEQLKVLGIPQTTISMAVFSSDSNSLFLGGNDGSALLVNARSGRKLRTFAGHIGAITGAAFSADGKYLLTGSNDNTARLWSLTVSPGLRVFSGHLIAGTSSALSLNGKLGFSLNDDYGVVANSPGLQRIWGSSNSNLNVGSPIIFSPDQKLALVIPVNVGGMIGGDDTKTPQLWDTESGLTLRSFSGHTSPVNWGAFSPDGKFVVTGSADLTARLWDVQTGQELRQFRRHTGEILYVVFSPSGKTILTTSRDKTARLWDVQTGKLILTLVGHTDAVTVAAFSHNGTQIVTGGGSRDGTARIWDVQTGQELHRFVTPPFMYSGDSYQDGVTDVAFSPNDKYVVTTDLNDGLSRLWDVQTGQEVHRFQTNMLGSSGNQTNRVGFSPDGKFIVINSLGSIYLWNTDIHDLYAFACAHIFRDFTSDERTAYGITDQSPTCPQFAAVSPH